MYEKHNWVTGEVITAEKLNNLENGVASSVLLLHITTETNDGVITSTLDKTWKEIKDAIMAGTLVICPREVNYGAEIEYSTTLIDYVAVHDGAYVVDISSEYTTDNENGYPSHSSEDHGPII